MTSKRPSKATPKMSQNEYSSWNTQQDLLTPYIDDASQWAHAHTSVSGYDYFHPMPATAHYSTLPAPGIPAYSAYPQASMSTGISYTTAPSYSYSPQPSYSTTAYTTSSPSFVPAMSSAFGSTAVPSTSTPGSSPRPPTSSSISTNSTYTQSTSVYGKEDLSPYGTLNPQTRTWTCAYPTCSSKAIFVRPCDLRKHFNRHSKNFFCRYEGCPQSEARKTGSSGGFSSKKDRGRHESKHDPGVKCEWAGCERVFSRTDNMRNHLARIHMKNRHTS